MIQCDPGRDGLQLGYSGDVNVGGGLPGRPHRILSPLASYVYKLCMYWFEATLLKCHRCSYVRAEVAVLLVGLFCSPLKG